MRFSGKFTVAISDDIFEVGLSHVVAEDEELVPGGLQ